MNIVQYLTCKWVEKLPFKMFNDKSIENLLK